MSKGPAVLLYPGRFVKNTTNLSNEQCGAYFMLLIHQANNGPFKKDAGIKLVGEELFNSISHKFKEKNGLYVDKNNIMSCVKDKKGLE